MQKMMIHENKEWFDGYEFLHFGIATEHVDGQLSIYTVVVCKDSDGYLEEVPISRVRFVNE